MEQIAITISETTANSKLKKSKKRSLKATTVDEGEQLQ